MPELPSGRALVPGQRTARDDVVAVAPPAAGESAEAAVPAGTPPLHDDEASADASSRWFDWRRARGIAPDLEADADSDEGPEPDAPEDPEAPDVPESSGEPSGAAAGPRAFPWFGGSAGS